MIRWCGKGGFADRKCTLDDTLDRWFDNRFPPLSIYHGGRDYLVLAEPLIERMKTKEKDVNVIKVTKLDLSEVRLFLQLPSSLILSLPFKVLLTSINHSLLRPTRLHSLHARLLTFQHCDFYWAAEAVEWAYTSMLDDIEATRSKYPGEEGEERDDMQTETEFRMDVQHEG